MSPIFVLQLARINYINCFATIISLYWSLYGAIFLAKAIKPLRINHKLKYLTFYFTLLSNFFWL